MALKPWQDATTPKDQEDPMHMTRTLTLLLLSFSGVAGAQSVYKCRDAAGAVVYQSAVCSGATEKQWTADPALASAPSTPLDRDAAERRIERDRQSLKASNRKPARQMTRSRRVDSAKPNPCERARQARAAAHERRGLRWSFDDASRWDAVVFKACR